MCCGEHCVLCKTDESQTWTPEVNNTLYVNRKKIYYFVLRVDFFNPFMICNIVHQFFIHVSLFFFFFFKDFIYLFHRQRSHVRQRSQVAERQAEREEKAGSPWSREPDAGLDPRTLGSWPEPKAEALTHWATQAPRLRIFLFSPTY